MPIVILLNRRELFFFRIKKLLGACIQLWLRVRRCPEHRVFLPTRRSPHFAASFFRQCSWATSFFRSHSLPAIRICMLQNRAICSTIFNKRTITRWRWRKKSEQDETKFWEVRVQKWLLFTNRIITITTNYRTISRNESAMIQSNLHFIVITCLHIRIRTNKAAI